MGNSGKSERLMELTGCASLSEALDWIADENPLRENRDSRQLIFQVLGVLDEDPSALAAFRTLVRGATQSDLDSAAFLLEVEAINLPGRFDDSLALLADQCPSGGLDSISDRALISAQRRNPFVIEALCSLVGLTYKELTQRVGDLPTTSAGHFGPSQLRAAFEEIDRIVTDPGDVPIDGAVPAVPIELLNHPAPSWQVIEEMRVNGVSLGHLLAQREVGGAWLSHRNRTANRLGPIMAQRLCDELESRSIRYERSTLLGGESTPSDLAAIAHCDRHVGVIAKAFDDEPIHGVVFSIARDGGTARANANRLINMNQSETVPLSVVVAGPGWTSRHETADLARAFGGRIYSDRSIDHLALSINEAITERGDSNVSSK
jgi:hypothetical protein